MKKILYSIAVVLLLAGCADFTDIKPKGKNLLSKVEDLDQLLNYDYQYFSHPTTFAVTGTMLPYNTNVPKLLAEPIKTTTYAYTFWDESIDRARLTESDRTYQEIYKIAGTICNPVIARADAATGSKSLMNRVKAEAHVMRAWVHYLAVNIYAKAYDPATAATDPGVTYLFEDELNNMASPCKKYTVQEVYDFIVADLDAAFALDALPDEGVNPQRAGKSFAYALQAKVLMSMRKYGEALIAARNSLAINSHIDDHNEMLEQKPSWTAGQPPVKVWQRPYLSSDEDLLAIFTMVLLEGFSQELLDMFDPDAVLLAHMPSMSIFDLVVDYGELYFGIPGAHVWASNYNAATFNGAGLTTVEMMLIEVECLMREGQLGQAMEKLEHIRKHRIITDKYEALPVPSDKTGVFAVLKQVSRCENFYSFWDFINLKRWNTETEYAETLRKNLLGTQYTLRPDSPLWIFPFPQSATSFNPGLTQNF